MITYLINTTNQILAKSKEVIHIKILTDAMDSSEWLEISKEEYDKLIHRDEILTALENGGVDNWEWYGESLSNYFDSKNK